MILHAPWAVISLQIEVYHPYFCAFPNGSFDYYNISQKDLYPIVVVVKCQKFHQSQVTLNAIKWSGNNVDYWRKKTVTTIGIIGACASACESRGSTASYASHRKQDKRIVLIVLVQRIPSSGSSWWSARPPPCYSLCSSQVSKCVSVFIRQVAPAWLGFFFPSYSVYPGVNEIVLIYLLSVSYQWTLAITKWTEVAQEPTHSVIKYVAAMQLCSASHWMQIMHDQWLTQEILAYNWLMCKPRKENKRRRYMASATRG